MERGRKEGPCSGRHRFRLSLAVRALIMVVKRDGGGLETRNVKKLGDFRVTLFAGEKNRKLSVQLFDCLFLVGV